MEGTNNIVTGLTVTGQLPLDTKTHCKNKNTLKDLGISNNKAFTYYKGLVVYCVEERERYEWREVVEGDIGIKLLDTDFTYPTNIVIGDIDYSNKSYNFYKVNIDLMNQVIVDGVNKGTPEATKIFIGKNNNNELEFAKISSENLIIETLPTGEVTINTPVSTDQSVKTFYVNEQYQGTSNGSIAKPYKKLTDALIAFIGNSETPLINPQYAGGQIIIQGSCTVNQEDFDDNPILENKLSINRCHISGEDTNKNIITINTTTDYPFDIYFLYNKASKDINGYLLDTLYFQLTNLTIVTSCKGIVKCYANYVLGDYTKPGSGLFCNNCYFNSKFAYNTNVYSIAKDYNNNNVVLFGGIVRVQDSIVNDTPHIHSIGINPAGDGHFQLNDCIIEGSSQTALKIENSSFSTTKLNISTSSYYVNVLDASSTDGIYQPSIVVNTIEVINSFFQIFDFTDINQYAGSKYGANPNEIKIIGGNNSFIKEVLTIPNQNPVHGSSIFIHKGYFYNGAFNNLVSITKGAGLFLKDFNSKSLQYEDTIFKNLTSLNIIDLIYITLENCKINRVINPSISNIRILANKSIINEFDFSSNPGYNNDVDALANGLIPGNIYYNLTTNSLKQIE